MKKVNKIFLILFIVALVGCNNTYKDAKDNVTKVEFAASNYPKIFNTIRRDIVEADLNKAIKENNRIGDIKQLKNLNYLESARLLQLDNNYKSSIEIYDKALKTVPKTEKESLKQAKSILLNKNTYNYYDIKMPYVIPDYAITFLYTYQALNYLETNNIKQAINVLNQLDSAELWVNQQNTISSNMKHLAKEDLINNDINFDMLGLKDFLALNKMFKFSKRIPNAYGNPLSYYLKAILISATSKNYNTVATDLNNARRYTVGNKYLDQTFNEFVGAINGQTSPFHLGMGRLVILYEQGLINTRISTEVGLDLGNIGIRKFYFPRYKTDYKFFGPKQVIISSDDNKVIVNTYTETLLDGTLFAVKSLIEEYSRIVTQNVIIEAFKYDYDNKNFALGGLLGSHLKFDLSKTDPKRADLRSWLLLPNSVGLFEQQLDSGSYNVQLNHIRQRVDIRQGKTTLLWVVDIGKFKKIFYFII